MDTKEKKNLNENKVTIGKTTYRVKRIFIGDKELKPLIISWIVAKSLKTGENFM